MSDKAKSRDIVTPLELVIGQEPAPQSWQATELRSQLMVYHVFAAATVKV
jgi:hypothetical protein